jgi:hypothetical protein
MPSLHRTDLDRARAQAFAEGVAVGRADGADIIAAAEKKGLERVAASLLLNPKLSKAEILDVLTAMPKGATSRFTGGRNVADDDALEQRRQELAALGKATGLARYPRRH